MKRDSQENVIWEMAYINNAIFIIWGFTKVGGYNPCVFTIHGTYLDNANYHLVNVFICSFHIIMFCLMFFLIMELMLEK